MQNKIVGTIVSLLAFFSCSNSNHRVSLDEFDEILIQESVQIIDLRTPSEVKSTGLIKDAIIKNYLDSDFNEYISKLDKSKNYIIYCRSGGRSSRAVKIFLSEGLKVYELGVGINGWQKEGRPLVKSL